MKNIHEGIPVSKHGCKTTPAVGWFSRSVEVIVATVTFLREGTTKCRLIPLSNRPVWDATT
jgi:hypothetical protein